MLDTKYLPADIAGLVSEEEYIFTDKKECTYERSILSLSSRDVIESVGLTHSTEEFCAKLSAEYGLDIRVPRGYSTEYDVVENAKRSLLTYSAWLPRGVALSREQVKCIIGHVSGHIIHGNHRTQVNYREIISIVIDTFLREGVELGDRIFDSAMVWGPSISSLVYAWLKSACNVDGAFTIYIRELARVMKRFGRLDFINIPQPKKGMRAEKYVNVLKGYKRVVRVCNALQLGAPTHYRCSYRELQRIGSLNYLTAYTILTLGLSVNIVTATGDDRTPNYNCYVTAMDVDYSVYSKVKNMSKRDKLVFLAKAGIMSQRSLWIEAIGRVPKGFAEIEGFNPLDLVDDKVAFKSFRALLAASTEEDPTNSYAIAVRLSMLFRDTQSINRWVKLNDNLHDSAQFSFVNALNTRWGSLVIKFPELQWRTQHFLQYNKDVGNFSTKKAFIEYCDSIKYDFTGIEESALYARYGLSTGDAKDYTKFFNKHCGKDAESVPNTVVVKGGYMFERVYSHDKEGVLLGLATDCCQHLHNAGKACAKAGWNNHDSAFFVIRKRGVIIAQSWAWRSKDDILVFDSIEALSDANVETVAELYRTAAKDLVGKLGIKAVVVGHTNYGITRDVRRYIKAEYGVLVKQSCPKMITSVSYSDAKGGVWKLA